MGLQINNNVAAMNAYRNLSGTQNADVQASLEKLSCGFRINRAADDAAGLAISESCARRSAASTRPPATPRTASALVQTAEGALNETHSILQRMRELAVQSSNGTRRTNDQRRDADARSRSSAGARPHRRPTRSSTA